MDIFTAISSLTQYGIKHGLLSAEDRTYTINLLIDALNLSVYEEKLPQDSPLEDILGTMLDYAVKNNIIEEGVTSRDLFDTKLMNCLLPRPSEVIKRFRADYAVSPEVATDNYYAFSKASDYIREYRVRNDEKWITSTEYGDIDITINLSKPEKDPRAIAAASKNKTAAQYPKCMLCVENEGFAGTLTHPARSNHRIIPITLDNEAWCLQYSPYVYYNEHCIVFNSRHIPMIINKNALTKLLSFVEMFPHYFLGSNAGLPIVGGSILSHEHYQGGRYEFAMAKAKIEVPLEFVGFPNVKGGIVAWPMSVLRIISEDKNELIELGDKILRKWQAYTDEEAFIFAETDGTPHNTVTPIARKRNGCYELDIVLRNNITTEQYPDGVYHAHPEHHHLKRENIGLIEVMGLAVLPSRLKKEMQILKEYLIEDKDILSNEAIAKHYAWAMQIKEKYENITVDNADKILQDEIGYVFTEILGQCGVFARTQKGKEQFLKFTDEINK